MKYVELKEGLKDFTLFSLNDIRLLDEQFHRRRLNEWQKKNYIKKIVRGYYVFSDLKMDENVLFEIANKIYSPSYISLEMAFSYYGLIPESVYEVTSISTRKTYSFKTPVAKFSFKSIKPDFFWGYEIKRYGTKTFKIAEPEKAVLDYFYFNSGIATRREFESMRFNNEVFSRLVNLKKFLLYLNRFHQKALQKRVGLFLEFMKNA
ncbi:MAG: hypothetical protein COT16_01245 [Elusimicrobia bacterium CG08_land_8_20_14_0_20_44_26]|nr:MAG: hypothetical protein COT16_01245 [Elusimicrobia bacterium CG08_land_8_20_14_0_20_44_26]